jgi:hypothetical protein
MKSEDESDLSAYLDDELDPGDRRDLEWSLRSDPALAARLAGLAAARDAVASLSRPEAPCSLVSSVICRIDAAERQGRRRPYYWLATAASILFALILSLRTGLLAPTPRPGNPVLVQFPTAPDSPRIETVSTLRLSPPAVSVAEAPPSSAPRPLGPAADPAEADRRRLVAMLDRPGLRRILIVTDILDPSAAERVNGLLRETARKQSDFGRITVAQGIIIDPEFPNEAEVFAAVMDEPERQQLLAKLAHEFPDAIIDGETPPEVTLQLAEIGQISIEPGRSAAGLREAPGDSSIVALRDPHAQSGRGEVVSSSSGGRVQSRDDPPFEGFPGGDMKNLPPSAVLPPELIGEHPARRDGPVHPKPPAPGPKKDQNRTTTAAPVLVWVTSSQPARRPE